MVEAETEQAARATADRLAGVVAAELGGPPVDGGASGSAEAG
jgi:hypothetical protein